MTINGVILAAGSASRMGEAKQLLLFRGKWLLEWVLEHAQNS
ncbi:MAG: NTP transferase domain-containing protein, partial [Proteobacteria bacterium]|nr:NTP transferase domain-containing protein [Pseudomonadota bacterium]